MRPAINLIFVLFLVLSHLLKRQHLSNCQTDRQTDSSVEYLSILESFITCSKHLQPAIQSIFSLSIGSQSQIHTMFRPVPSPITILLFLLSSSLLVSAQFGNIFEHMFQGQQQQQHHQARDVPSDSSWYQNTHNGGMFYGRKRKKEEDFTTFPPYNPLFSPF